MVRKYSVIMLGLTLALTPSFAFGEILTLDSVTGQPTINLTPDQIIQLHNPTPTPVPEVEPAPPSETPQQAKRRLKREHRKWFRKAMRKARRMDRRQRHKKVDYRVVLNLHSTHEGNSYRATEDGAQHSLQAINFRALNATPTAVKNRRNTYSDTLHRYRVRLYTRMANNQGVSGVEHCAQSAMNGLNPGQSVRLQASGLPIFAVMQSEREKVRRFHRAWRRWFKRAHNKRYLKRRGHPGPAPVWESYSGDKMRSRVNLNLDRYAMSCEVD